MIFMFLWVRPLWADTPEDGAAPPEEAPATDAADTLVVTGTRTRTRLGDTPVATQVISREDLASSGADTLAGPWVNVLDPDFNLHVDTTRVCGAWAVHKPTTDGPVHSLELLDDDGEVSVRVFGARKPGRPEDPRWVEVLDAVGARAPGPGA